MNKKKNYQTLLLCVMMLAITSCSIEKRIHTKGYFVKWHATTSLFQKNNPIEKGVAELENDTQVPIEISSLERNTNKENQENLPSQSLINEDESAMMNQDEISRIAHDKNQTPSNFKQETISPKPEFIVTDSETSHSYRADTELLVNIGLTILLLALIILFIYLALPAIGTMVYVWWGLATVCTILFVTQVIDLILW